MKKIMFPHVDDIIVPEDRQRREFPEEAQQELLNDIQRRGLLNPIIVRGEDDLTLVTGERRLRAIRILHDIGFDLTFQGQKVEEGRIPTLHLNECDRMTALEAEFAENVVRLDLTWQEETRARAMLHELRSHEAEERGEKQTVSDTAREIAETPSMASIKGNVEDISNSIRLADYLDDPDVAKAKSQNDAVKVVRKKLEREERQKRAAEFKENPTPHELLHGDSFDIVPTLASNSFDIVLTDPPYGQEMHESVSWNSSIHEYDDSPEYFRNVVEMVADESWRLLKDDGHAYIFCSFEGFFLLAERLAIRGFDVWPKPLIWYKGNIGSYPKPFHGPRLTYECILYAVKGDKRVNQLYHDVIADVPQVQKQDHPAGKPWELYYDLLRRSALPGDRVIDMFAGKGTIFPAASKADCTAVGIENNEYYHSLAVETLQNAYEI